MCINLSLRTAVLFFARANHPSLVANAVECRWFLPGLGLYPRMARQPFATGLHGVAEELMRPWAAAVAWFWRLYKGTFWGCRICRKLMKNLLVQSNVIEVCRGVFSGIMF